MHAEQVQLVCVACNQMWNLINVHRTFPCEGRHDKIVFMSVEMYLADGLAFLVPSSETLWLTLEWISKSFFRPPGRDSGSLVWTSEP